MTVIETVKKVVTDNTYAAVGAGDLAVERAREARTQMDALRAELAPKKISAKVQAAPAEVYGDVREAAAKAQKSYEDLTVRGEKLVKRIRNQKATKDLIGQAEATVALGKGAVTTVRNAAGELERSAKSTLTTTRKEAAKAAEAVAGSVKVDVKVDTDKAAEAVKTSAKKTRTAAKRTTTTAKKGAARTTSATKATATSARKTAAKSTKAAEKAAEKVGD